MYGQRMNNGRMKGKISENVNRRTNGNICKG